MKIRFYGSLGEAIGREVEIEAPAGGTVAELRRKLLDAHPTAAGSLSKLSTRACVDGTILGEDATLNPGDQVEFFPPLSGG